MIQHMIVPVNKGVTIRAFDDSDNLYDIKECYKGYAFEWIIDGRFVSMNHSFRFIFYKVGKYCMELKVFDNKHELCYKEKVSVHVEE